MPGNRFERYGVRGAGPVHKSKSKCAGGSLGSDFPIDPETPDFPHHSQVIKYFNDYVDHFGLRDGITFNCAVEHCERHEDGVWRVTLGSGEVRHYVSDPDDPKRFDFSRLIDYDKQSFKINNHLVNVIGLRRYKDAR